MIENPDSRGPLEEAVSILGNCAASRDRQSEAIQNLQLISTTLLLYTHETLDLVLAGSITREALNAFESVTAGVETVVSTVRSIHGL